LFYISYILGTFCYLFAFNRHMKKCSIQLLQWFVCPMLFVHIIWCLVKLLEFQAGSAIKPVQLRHLLKAGEYTEIKRLFLKFILLISFYKADFIELFNRYAAIWIVKVNLQYINIKFFSNCFKIHFYLHYFLWPRPEIMEF